MDVLTDHVDKESVYLEVVDELSRARDIVRKCLFDDDRCRNDDQWLMLRVWQKQGIVIMVDFSRWKEVFSPETIRRVRQEIQSTHNDLPGELLPTDPDVLVKRKVKEEAIRDYYGTKSWILNAFKIKKYGIT